MIARWRKVRAARRAHAEAGLLARDTDDLILRVADALAR